MTERPDHRVELADAIRELTEPRKAETRYEVRELNKRGNWKRSRKTHRAQLPSLLESLAEALEPAGDGDVLMAGSFESQPSADMGAIAAAAQIQSEALGWAKTFKIKVPKTLAGLLPLLVSAPATASQIGYMAGDAKSWVRVARLATGFDVPFTPDVACPYCLKKHSLIADLDPKDASRKVQCKACKTKWDETTIGLLAEMITANQTRTTMTDTGPCVVEPECYRRGPHEDHWDSQGRTTGRFKGWEDDDRYVIYPKILPSLPAGSPSKPMIDVPKKKVDTAESA